MRIDIIMSLRTRLVIKICLHFIHFEHTLAGNKKKKKKKKKYFRVVSDNKSTRPEARSPCQHVCHSYISTRMLWTIGMTSYP